MSGPRIAAAVLLISAAIAGTQEIPPATALPISMNTPLDVRKLVSGQPISGSIAQDVPLPSGGKIRSGSRVTGRVLQAGTKLGGRTYVRLRFDQVSANGRDIAITTSLRAVASSREVQDAQLPEHGPILGESSANWTTTQVGGDVVYRGGGQVMHDNKEVGEPVKDGVLTVLVSAKRPGCETASGDRRLALWVFSSSACGAYGYYGRLDIARAGDSSPLGEIVLESRKNLKVGTGSAMLLITIESSQPQP
jgi:hypothetical protein